MIAVASTGLIKIVKCVVLSNHVSTKILILMHYLHFSSSIEIENLGSVSFDE
jgi:hypothetical protein